MDDSSLSDSNVKVAVRVRPMNRREKDLKTKCVVQMGGNQTVLQPAVTNVSKGDPRNQPKVFAYDYCFWSMDESQKDKFAVLDRSSPNRFLHASVITSCLQLFI